MAYFELIKNFQRIRGYMKEFYIYGFKTRGEYDKKSARSYDNEKRRIESYLGNYMGFHQTQEGKNVFLSIDSRKTKSNPLYKALKAKSFTDGDITLHFIIFDILYAPNIYFSLSEITEKIDEDYLSKFSCETFYDESTVRKKLKEYTELGLIKTQKQGKQVLYSRVEDLGISNLLDSINFFSEVSGCGVIGSFLLDKYENNSCFSFKHHYINNAIDSEILCEIFSAIYERNTVEIIYEPQGKNIEQNKEVIPLKIYVSTQNGRQYLIAYNLLYKTIKVYRLDYIKTVKQMGKAENYQQALELYKKIKKHLWGVSIGDGKIEHVEFTVHIGDNEEHIYNRLLREKRIGTVTRVDKNTCVFSADVYSTNEMIPWIRTFICRITKINFSNRTIENQFKQDIENMYSIYGI